MVILGLTGSIGMGKTTAAAFLRYLGVPVHDADATVHEVLSKGGAAVKPVRDLFPDAVKDGAVDRAVLSRRVVDDPGVLKKLEAILHPMAREARDRFLLAQALRRTALVVLDVPLLFETGGEQRCDAVIVVSAPDHVQKARVMVRPDMTEDKYSALMARQMPDAEKRRRADYVVPTGHGMQTTLHDLARIVTVMRRTTGRHWPFNPNFRRCCSRTFRYKSLFL